MGYCPYSETELAMWDSVCNPMGDACYDCDEFECDHNPNPSPEYDGWEDPMDEVYQ